jgi:hypothetical protein
MLTFIIIAAVAYIIIAFSYQEHQKNKIMDAYFANERAVKAANEAEILVINGPVRDAILTGTVNVYENYDHYQIWNLSEQKAIYLLDRTWFEYDKETNYFKAL